MSKKETKKLCVCGCRKFVARKKYWPYTWNKYINGHNWKGKCHSKETKAKISVSEKGKIVSAETREKMSESAKRRNENPENNPNWKGGFSLNYPREYKEVRERIRERDNRTCQLCGKIEKQNRRKLDVHHIDYNIKNSDSKNLITLCNPCNKKVESDKEIWSRFFKDLIKKIYKQKGLK